jgi:SHAQKYF class myb-like DNA-binding protein
MDLYDPEVSGAMLDLSADLCNDEKNLKSNIQPRPGERTGEPSPNIESGGKASPSMVGYQPNANFKDGKCTSFSHSSTSFQHQDGAGHLTKSPGLSEDTSAEIGRRPQEPIRDDQINRYDESKVPQKMTLDVTKICRGDLAISEPEGITGEGDSGGGMTSTTKSISSLMRDTTVDLKTGMTVAKPSENLPIPMTSTIRNSTMWCMPDEDTPASATMNSSDDTPILHALKRTSTTDASEHEGSSPTKKKTKQSLYSSSYEEIPSVEGYWTNEEHSQFEKGVILYGWGNWKKVESCVPTRNNVQIKTHAQKFSNCRPSQKDRLLSMYEENAHSLQLSKDLNKSRMGHQRKPDLSKARPLPLTQRKQEQDSEWSIIEKKQFEDGCVFHGWGSWYDIAAHIVTKDIDQVLKYAETYSSNDRERLKREHNLDFQDDDNALINQDQDPKTDTQKLHQGLIPEGSKSPPKSIIQTNNDEEETSSDDESEVASQPPPSWLAVDNWDTVLANIQRWRNRLTESERSMEYEKYHSLPEREKDRVRKRLMRLMENRPVTAV